jgi:DNA polymerase
MRGLFDPEPAADPDDVPAPVPGAPPAGPSTAVDDAPPDVPAAAELDGCRRCDLWRDATHGVPGEGPSRAALMLVGEQPGDVEDREARPFVGPAGRLLDEVLAAAGVDRGRVWMTNAVKHFKWTPRGTRRIHVTPGVREVKACAWWLERELAAVRPRVVVALGATAARALLGPGATVEASRRDGPFRVGGRWVVVTYHPSALLRAPDPESRERMTAALRGDLERAASLLDGRGDDRR